MERFIWSAPNKGPHSFEESAQQVFERYLQELNINKGDLVGKKILDVGAESGSFAQALKKAGIPANVVSVDKYGPVEGQLADTSLVMATAQSLPFKDNEFDLVVSVSALPHVAHVGLVKQGISKESRVRYEQEAKELIAQAVRECMRVVKAGGEVRFGGLPKELKEYVLAGLKVGLGEGTVITSPQVGSENLFILRK